jgi:hypothetical protein
MAGPLERSAFPEPGNGRRRALRVAAVAAVTAAAAFAIGIADASPVHARAHATMRDQPPLAHTGGFGEPTCIACHFDGEINDPAGSLTLEGIPPRYEPGRRYRITVTVRHPELKLAGFELASRFATGPDSGKQAGTLSVTDDRAGTSRDSTTHIQYAHHLRSGTTPFASATGRWTVEWTAPTAGSAPVTFHVAANAANDNDSPLGDYIFSRSVSVPIGEK